MTRQFTTRERIRTEAAALFREKGFNGTSMADLSTEVGITKSSLYHHFPCKQSLLAEIVDLTVNRVEPLVRAVADSDLPVRQRLARAIAIHTVEGIVDQDAIACFTEEGRYLSPEYMAPHIRQRDRYERIFRRILDEGIESGDFLPQDTDLTIKAILGMCNSVVRWYRPGGSHTAEQIAADFARFALRGATGAPEPALAAPVGAT